MNDHSYRAQARRIAIPSRLSIVIASLHGEMPRDMAHVMIVGSNCSVYLAEFSRESPTSSKVGPIRDGGLIILRQDSNTPLACCSSAP